MPYDFNCKNTSLKYILFLALIFQFLYANSTEFYQNKAQELKLAQAHYWQLLLHMNDGISEIDDPRFFMAKDGKYNASNELLASIEALFSQEKKDDESFICRFPARTHWLKEKLNIDNLSNENCKEYKKIIKRLDPQSATLVFSSAHINSPASMFGHTFLRIDSSYESKLLSYAVNYAAMADQNTENGVVFAIKGLFGGYYGRYSLLPYYEKLKEYSDTEQRDVWEYDLNLTHDEVKRMVEHIWELNNTFSDYFFFDENCSYNLLWLIEVARPTVSLRQDYFFQVIPAETMFTIEKEKLIKEIQYRPSKRTRLLRYEEILTQSERQNVMQLSTGKLSVQKWDETSQLSLKRKQLLLECAVELTEYYFIENDITKEQYLDIFHKLTSKRATLGRGEKLAVERPSDPLKGHQALRATLQTKYVDSETSVLLGLRPAYHDITNSDIGFLQGTQIEFLDTVVEINEDDIDLEYMTILSIASYVPQTDFFAPMTWRTKFAVNSDYMDDKNHLNGAVAAGTSWYNPLGYHYVLIEPMIHATHSTRFSIAPVFGAVIDRYPAFKTNFEVKQRYYDDKENQVIANITQSWYIRQNVSLHFSYEYTEKFENNDDVIKIGLNYFF